MARTPGGAPCRSRGCFCLANGSSLRNRSGQDWGLLRHWGLNWGLRCVLCSNLQPLRCHPCACKLFGINFPLNAEIDGYRVEGFAPTSRAAQKPQVLSSDRISGQRFVLGTATPAEQKIRYKQCKETFRPSIAFMRNLRFMGAHSARNSRPNISLSVYLRLTRMFVCCGPPASF